MIDTSQWDRDLEAVIADLPVRIRYPIRTGPVFDVSFHDMGSSLAVIEPGLEDVKSATVVALKSSFTLGLPEDEDDVEIQKPGGGWTVYTVKSIVGADNPAIGEVTINLEAEK